MLKLLKKETEITSESDALNEGNEFFLVDSGKR